MCAIAHLSGFSTVKEAMQDTDFQTFVENLLTEELIPALPEYIREEEALSFGKQVIDRFKNPFIDHHWLSIAQNYTQKLEMRVLPLLYQAHEKRQDLPALLVYGLGAYIRFMKVSHSEKENAFGTIENRAYPIQDRQATHWEKIWSSSKDLQEVVQKALQQKDFWGGQDLSLLHGLVSLLTIYLEDIERQLMAQGRIDLRHMTERIN
jgi:tagaturonate reductase